MKFVILIISLPSLLGLIPNQAYSAPVGYGDEFDMDCPIYLGPGRKGSEESDELEKPKRHSAEKRLKKEAQRTEKKRKEVRARLEERSSYGQEIRDYLTLEWLKSLEAKNPVSLLLGNPYQEPSSKEVRQYQELSARIAARALVIYDADSKAASLISEAAGDFSVGVTKDASQSHLKKLKHVVEIANPYLRMKALSETFVAVMSPDSISGLALAVNKSMSYVFDPLSVWKPGLVEFSDSLIEQTNMGISYSYLRSPEVYQNVDDLSKKVSKFFGRVKRSGSLDPDLKSILEHLDGYELYRILEDASVVSKGKDAMKRIPGGAVVFGSSAYSSQYADLLYSVSYLLAQKGVPIVTGGSGGFMRTANTAAYDAGAHSIGISLGAGFSLISEKEIAADAQTLTVASTDYETRIPLLLDRRALIVVAPGGKGTMNELATALVQMASDPDGSEQLVFVSGTYYKMLAQWLKSSFPEDFATRVHLVERADEISDVLNKLERSDPEIWRQLRTATPPRPRNSRTSYELGSSRGDSLDAPETIGSWYLRFKKFKSKEHK